MVTEVALDSEAVVVEEEEAVEEEGTVEVEVVEEGDYGVIVGRPDTELVAVRI